MPLPGLPAELWPLLARAAAPGRLAVVGGAVRDLFLHREHRDPWRGLMDLDLVVEAPTGTPGSPAEALLRALQGCPGVAIRSASPHGRYGTVEINLQVAGHELLLDVATAREESYLEPAANPVVRFGPLEQDLARRDFSINAMALVLDPTRILRGARYAARLGFRLAPQSLEQVRDTLARWPWAWRFGDPPGQAPPALGTRLRMELELMLARENWKAALGALRSWGGLTLLDPALQADDGWARRLAWARRLGVDPMAALAAGAADPIALAERLQLPHRQHRQLAQVLALRDRLEAVAREEDLRRWSPSRWCAFLEAPGTSPEAVALALAVGLGPRRPLLRWWLRWRHLRSAIGAERLIAAGEPPGPALGRRLRQLRAERLDRERL